MTIVLKTVEQTDEAQLKNHDTTKYVRKNWIISAAYYVAMSFAMGLGIALSRRCCRRLTSFPRHS